MTTNEQEPQETPEPQETQSKPKEDQSETQAQEESKVEKPVYISFEAFGKLDLRTALVLEVKDHSNADKLYLVQVRIGDQEKQIVAGIKAFLQPEDLVGKTVIVVNNLKPAKLRGEWSNGMLLAVHTGDGLTFLTTAHEVESGLKVS